MIRCAARTFAELFLQLHSPELTRCVSARPKMAVVPTLWLLRPILEHGRVDLITYDRT